MQQWAATTALELQKWAKAAIKSLEAERVPLQNARAGFERNALQTMQDAMPQQSAGIVVSLMMGYFMVVHTQNAMDDRLDKFEQFLSARAQPVPAAPDVPAPAHKGKAK